MTLVEPSKAPRLGKGGSPESRVAILHSLAHIESWAIDLSWDIIARFGAPRAMPREFFDDFVAVAVDEARHFKLLAARLDALGSRRGSAAGCGSSAVVLCWGRVSPSPDALSHNTREECVDVFQRRHSASV